MDKPDDPHLDAILAGQPRPEDLPPEELQDLEIVGALAAGRLTVDQLNDQLLERLDHTLGTEQLADALLSRHPQTLLEASPPPAPIDFESFQRSQQSQRAQQAPRRQTPRGALWLMAACILIAVALGVWYSQQKPSKHPEIAWSDLQFSISDRPIAFTSPSALPKGLPDLRLAGTPSLMGANDAPPDYGTWATATVIVQTDEGFGSGALISADGWLVTNYHVIAAAAQAAAVGSTSQAIHIWTCEPAGGSFRARTSPLPATIYRADPLRDLALLRLDSLPPGVQKLPFFPLAKEIHIGDKCYAIGSPHNAPPWTIVPGNISSIFAFPNGLTDTLLAGVNSRPNVERPCTTVVATTCPIASGDSGGPLINARGELLGITFATPANMSSGATGFHIAVDPLRDFLSTLPTTPEDIPFDLLQGGYPDAKLLKPLILAPTSDNPCSAMVFPILEDSESRAAEHPDAILFLVKFGAVAAAAGPPAGLWGTIGSPDAFRFDFCMVLRKDGLSAAGYTDAGGTVDEIRIGRRDEAHRLWKRGADGRWLTSTVSREPVLLDTRIDEKKLADFAALTRRLHESPPAGGPPVPPDEGRANKLQGRP